MLDAARPRHEEGVFDWASKAEIANAVEDLKGTELSENELALITGWFEACYAFLKKSDHVNIDEYVLQTMLPLILDLLGARENETGK